MRPQILAYLVMLAAILRPHRTHLTIDHSPAVEDLSHPVAQFDEAFDISLRDWWSSEGTKLVPDDQHVEVLIVRTATIHGYFAKIKANGQRITSTPFESQDADIAGTSCARAMIAWYQLPRKKG